MKNKHRPFRDLLGGLGFKSKEDCMPKDMEEPRIYLCGLDRKTDVNGHEYLVGEMSDNTVMFVYPNRRKTNDDSPDYHAYLRERKPGEGVKELDGNQRMPEFPV